MPTLVRLDICSLLKVSILHPDDGPMSGPNHSVILK